MQMPGFDSRLNRLHLRHRRNLLLAGRGHGSSAYQGVQLAKPRRLFDSSCSNSITKLLFRASRSLTCHIGYELIETLKRRLGDKFPRHPASSPSFPQLHRCFFCGCLRPNRLCRRSMHHPIRLQRAIYFYEQRIT